MLSKPFSACAGPYGWNTSALTGTTIKTRRQRQTVPWRSMAVPAKPPLEVQRHQQLFNLNVNRQLTRAGGRVSLRLMLKVNKETERGRWTETFLPPLEGDTPCEGTDSSKVPWPQRNNSDGEASPVPGRLCS